MQGEISVGDIYREEQEERGEFFQKPRMVRGALYEVVEVEPNRVKLRLWDGSGLGAIVLEPVDLLLKFNLWRSVRWAKLSQQEFYGEVN